MSHFDTLIYVDTLIFSQTLGLNRQLMIEEVKIQYVNPCTQQGICVPSCNQVDRRRSLLSFHLICLPTAVVNRSNANDLSSGSK